MEFVVAKYYVESKLPIEIAAKRIAEEQSTGTWTDVKADEVHEKYGAKVLKANDSEVEIGLPVDLFEPRNIPQVLSVIAGNIFGLGAIENLRLIDIELPKSFIRHYRGPRIGIKEIRRIGKIYNRPLLGTIVKPKVGLTPEQTAERAYQAALGGVDLIKDDETLSNQKFCPLKQRVSRVMKKLDELEAETGKKTFYAVNVTCGADEIVDRAELALKMGANMLMVDVITAGFSALQALNEANLKVPIHVHRTMHAAMTRNPRHGISMLVFARLARLAGASSLHVGSYMGKMDRNIQEIDACRDAIRSPWYNLKPVFPVASGGIHPRTVAANLQGFGIDCFIQAGGGIHGHPQGTAAGAAAMRQAIDAWLKGISVEEYAKEHEELRVALEHWGGD
ncbi:MAG: RuBisCO large subunit C-terminal-like domain-containing protein [Methanocellales archaeon]